MRPSLDGGGRDGSALKSALSRENPGPYAVCTYLCASMHMRATRGMRISNFYSRYLIMSNYK